MKLQVGRNELLSALSAVIGVVERRQTLPVLSNFLLELRDDELIVTGTDLEIELEARARVQNLAPGRATVPEKYGSMPSTWQTRASTLSMRPAASREETTKRSLDRKSTRPQSSHQRDSRLTSSD